MDYNSFQQSVTIAHTYVSSHSRVSAADDWDLVLFLGQLPALRDGMTWATGFRGIVEYLRKKSEGQVDLDALLSDTEKAETTAYVFHASISSCVRVQISIIWTNIDSSAPIQLLSIHRGPRSITHRSLPLRLRQKL